jgi:aryl-alcohol dehydrogenase-like predicted oxidoreductase
VEQRNLGSLRVSVAGLGTNNFGMRIDHEQSLAVIRAAFDEGVTFFDTADVYSAGTSEEWLAEALAPVRDEVVIATKFGWYEGAAATSATAAVEGSLRRLRTDCVDLLYCHRPDPKRAHRSFHRWPRLLSTAAGRRVFVHAECEEVESEPGTRAIPARDVHGIFPQRAASTARDV